jgi:hypothetical protein
MFHNITNPQLSKISSAWPTIVDANSAAHSAPIKLDGHTLTIGTTSSSWSQQLQFLSNAILDGIEAHAPGANITKILFRVGAFPKTEVAPLPESRGLACVCTQGLNDPICGAEGPCDCLCTKSRGHVESEHVACGLTHRMEVWGVAAGDVAR